MGWKANLGFLGIAGGTALIAFQYGPQILAAASGFGILANNINIQSLITQATATAQPVILNIQQNWKAYVPVATFGFAIGVPIFRWFYNRYKTAAKNALERKRTEIDLLKTQNESYRQQLEQTGKTAEEKITDVNSQLDSYKTKYQSLFDQKTEFDKTLQRVQDQRDRAEQLLREAQKRIDELTPKPVP